MDETSQDHHTGLILTLTLAAHLFFPLPHSSQADSDAGLQLGDDTKLQSPVARKEEPKMLKMNSLIDGPSCYGVHFHALIICVLLGWRKKLNFQSFKCLIRLEKKTKLSIF